MGSSVFGAALTDEPEAGTDIAGSILTTGNDEFTWWKHKLGTQMGVWTVVTCGEREGDTLPCKLNWYLPPQRVWFMSLYGLKWEHFTIMKLQWNLDVTIFDMTIKDKTNNDIPDITINIFLARPML